MNLVLIWSCFILLVSYSEEFNLYQYFFFSNFMLGLTYLYNQISYVNLSLRTTLLLLNIPSLILWYITFVYNDFLAINPISYEFFIGLFLIHSYLILYLILNEEFTNTL